MQHIPEKYQKTNLSKPATFESKAIGLEIKLLPREEMFNEETKKYQLRRGTGVAIRFKGHKFSTQNKDLLKLLMEDSAYDRGLYGIDPEDPTGFWRDQGMVHFETRKIVVDTNITKPLFADIDTKKLTDNVPETLMRAPQ